MKNYQQEVLNYFKIKFNTTYKINKIPTKWKYIFTTLLFELLFYILFKLKINSYLIKGKILTLKKKLQFVILRSVDKIFLMSPICNSFFTGNFYFRPAWKIYIRKINNIN